jgi:hypothetical protein
VIGKILTAYGIYAAGIYVYQRFLSPAPTLIPPGSNFLLDPLGSLIGYPIGAPAVPPVANAVPSITSPLPVVVPMPTVNFGRLARGY